MGSIKCCDFLAGGIGEATKSLERQAAALQHSASETAAHVHECRDIASYARHTCRQKTILKLRLINSNRSAQSKTVCRQATFCKAMSIPVGGQQNPWRPHMQRTSKAKAKLVKH